MSVGLLLVGLIAGYFIGKSGTDPVVYQTATPTMTASPSTSTTPDMAGWKTFNALKSGYSFSYPASWPIVESEKAYPADQGALVTTFGANYLFDVNVRTLPATDQIVSQHDKCDGPNQKNIGKITIAGSEATKCGVSGGVPTYQAMMQKASSSERADVYVFTCGTEEKICDQVLSTFRFTK